MLTWSLEHPYLTFILAIFGMATFSNVIKMLVTWDFNTKKSEVDEKQQDANEFPEGEDLARLYQELSKKPPNGKVH